MYANCRYHIIKISNKPAKGFTMLELMISMSVGLVLFAGVMSIFVGMRTTTTETSSFGELQENGRFAISVLTDDLLKQDFWGDYTGVLNRANLISVPAAQPGNDCIGGGINNRTFPLTDGSFRTIWGQTLTDSNSLTCFGDASLARVGSDFIQFKRVLGNPIDRIQPANLLPDTTAGNYYLRANNGQGGIYLHGATVPDIDNARTWLYQHHVYFVREESAGTNTIPVLMQGRLVNQNMSFDPIVDGIEMIRFMYGIDTSDDGVINAYVSADNMTDSEWDSVGGTRILAVKVYVLARSIQPDFKYDNTSTYLLGDLQVPVNDNFRRLLFSSTITLYNARVN